MFDLLPFRKKNEDAFEKLMKTLNEVFDQNRFTKFDEKLQSFRTDIKENKNAYFVEADLPGFTKEDITIELVNNQLTIHAKRDEEKETKDKNDKVIRQERHFGEFIRQFYVDNIDEDKIEATLKNGVLKMKLPKQTPDDEPRKKIEVR